MNPAHSAVYTNPDREAQAIWGAEQIVKMMAQHGIAPTSIRGTGVFSNSIIENVGRLIGNDSSVWPHEVPLEEIELNDCRADPVLHDFLNEVARAQLSPSDVFLILDVMEHIENYHGFLRAARALGVYKIFHVPMDMTVHTVARRNALRARRDVYCHISYFTKDTFLRVLEDTGYDVLDTFYTPWRIDFSTELTGKLMKLPRKWLFALAPDAAVRILGGYGLLVLAK